MWLINVSTLTLEFFINPIPRSYATLSHTWGNGEVSFQDFQNPDEAKKKAGFEKIASTCELARRRSLSYAWVDTCCIDKSSSAELSEAINSMFQWYKASAVCFVFLFDLQPSPDPTSGHHIPPDAYFEEKFVACRWLRRGWTLQELIAPYDVEFYDRTWTMRGTKAERKMFLSRVTGIDVKVLEDSRHLSQIVVARRMSWAAHRETTRIEDMAYCLLGIFDINMPMIYGEGPKAFMRLQEEIAKQSCDLSLLAWRAATAYQKYRGIFARGPHEFWECGQLEHRHKGLPIETEFTITNKGLRLETTLVDVVDNPEAPDLVFNLGVCDREYEWPKDTSDGWMGVYLVKTARGYARTRPHELYTAGQEQYQRARGEMALLHIRKDLGLDEADLIHKQYYHAILLRSVTGNPSISLAQPKDLWDSQQRLFLSCGSGLNVFIGLEFPETRDPPIRKFHAIVVCSTMEELRCMIWSEQDSVPFNAALDYMKSALQVTDYITSNYMYRQMQMYLGKLVAASGASSCRFRDPESGRSVKINVMVEPDMIQGTECFAIDVDQLHCE